MALLPNVAFGRSMAIRFLNEPCTVKHATLIGDGHGGTTKTGTVDVATRCYIEQGDVQPHQSDEQPAGQIVSAQRWTVSLPVDIEISPRDEIVLDTGRRFRVLSLIGPFSTEVVRDVLAIEIQK